MSRSLHAAAREPERPVEAHRQHGLGGSLIEKAAQLEMFPTPRQVEVLDPRAVIGPATRVSALYRVRYGDAAQVHQVYRDRHGWYCGEHGPGCAAVADAVDAAHAS